MFVSRKFFGDESFLSNPNEFNDALLDSREKEEVQKGKESML